MQSKNNAKACCQLELSEPRCHLGQKLTRDLRDRCPKCGHRENTWVLKGPSQRKSVGRASSQEGPFQETQVVGISPRRGFSSSPAGFRACSRAMRVGICHRHPLPRARLYNLPEWKTKEVAKALGTFRAHQAGTRCPGVQQASVECLLEYDVIRVWALKPARSGFKSRLCHLPGAVPLAEFKFF